MARKKNKQHKQTKSPTPPAMRFDNTSALPALALCALIVIAFFPATWAGFVWDDLIFTDAKPVRSWAGLWQIWFEPSALASTREGHYWPVLYSTFWLEHKLWGFDPLGYHLVNLALHSAVTVLLWRLLVRMAVPGAWLAAAVFAVHPVHTEAVAWVIGRKDVLAALFYLTSAWFYIRFVEERRSRRDYTLAIMLFALGMLAKSTVVTLPAALLLWHWWRGRVTAADFTRVLPLLLTGLLIGVADWSYYKGVEDVSFDYSLVERALIAAQALWFYLGKLAWPMPLMVIYPRFTVGVGSLAAWMVLIAAAALIAALWFSRHRITRGPLLGALFFALTLSPTLGFVDYGYMQFSFVADRYQYLAAAGIITTVVAAVTVAVARAGVAEFVMPTVATALLTVLGALSWQQAGIYKDRDTFYTHITSHNPDARNAHYNLAKGHYLAGRFAEAHAAFGIARAQRPDWFYPHVGMGTTAAQLGRLDEAEAHFEAALEVAPHSPEVLNHLGAFRLKQRRYQDALELFERLIQLQPGHALYHSNRGAALFHLRRWEDALTSFDRALQLDPSLADARSNREKLLRMMRSGVSAGSDNDSK